MFQSNQEPAAIASLNHIKRIAHVKLIRTEDIWLAGQDYHKIMLVLWLMMEGSHSQAL